MSVKRFNTRVQNKIDSTGTWKSSATVPLKGEIVIGTSGQSNTNDTPYVLKIGDGSSLYSSLPSIGPNIFQGQTAVFLDDTLTFKVGADMRTYALYAFPSNNVTDFTLKVECSTDPMLTEHYLLIDNTAGTNDKLIENVNILVNGTSMSSSDIYIQKSYITAGDIVEIKVLFFRISSTLKCSITMLPGITNGGII